MATKFTVNWASAVQLFAVFRNTDGEVYYIVGDVMEAWGGGAGRDADDYDVQGTSYTGGLHVFTVPATLAEGTYITQVFEQAGGAPADTDVVDVIAEYSLRWTGSAIADPGGSVTGDYLVTLTIRTSGGTPLGGVQVWLSADNDRENPVQATKVTNDSGVVTFYLDYALYYIHCKLTGYTFVPASFTSAAGSVAFTKDIATAVTAGTDNEYSDSFITRALEVCRTCLDAPTINKKYSDNYLLRRMEASYPIILGEKQRNENPPVVVTLPVTMVSGQDDYSIPPTLGPIVSVYYDYGSGIKLFYYEYGPFHVGGQGVWVEGNTLRKQSGFDISSTITVEALPRGVARLHRGTCTIDADGDAVTLGATPNKGTLDTGVKAYLGSILRIIQVTGTSPTGNNVQERLISGYDATTRVADLLVPLDPIPAAGAGGAIYYEIMPQLPIGLDMLPALYVAWEINQTEGKADRARGCKDTYNNNMRHLRLNAFFSRLDIAALVDSDSYLNPGQSSGYGYGQGFEIPYASVAGVP